MYRQSHTYDISETSIVELQPAESDKEALKKDFDKISVNDYNVYEIKKPQDLGIPERLNNDSTDVIAVHEHQNFFDMFNDYPLSTDAYEDKNANAKVDIAKITYAKNADAKDADAKDANDELHEEQKKKVFAAIIKEDPDKNVENHNFGIEFLTLFPTAYPFPLCYGGGVFHPPS